MQEKMKIEHAYTNSIDQVLKKLNSNTSEGLSHDEAAKRLLLGKNKIITPQPSVWKLYLAPLFDVLIVVYLIMTAIMLILSIFVEGLVGKVGFWLVLIAFNMGLAIFQQFRAQKKLSSLSDLSPPMTTVIRNGMALEIKAEDLVVGDIVILTLGDKVPADARIVDSSSLQVNEASLTGESDPVSKFEDGSDGMEEGTELSKRKNMVYLGTFIQVGEAKVVVVRTGNDTELGKIATQMSEMQTMEMPLRQKINALGKGLSALMVSFLVVLIIFTAIVRSRSDTPLTFNQFAFDIAQAIINAMAVMPINIPLLTTVVLITGVLNMAQKKVVIKDLTAVETLGRVSVLCSDKTGTMTSSLMTAKLLYVLDEEGKTGNYFGVCQKNGMKLPLYPLNEDDVSDFMESQNIEGDELEQIESASTLGLLLTSAILNNKATIKPKIEDYDRRRQIGWEVNGNPTDAALLMLAKAHGFPENYVKYRYKTTKSYPFNSTVKRMSCIAKDTEEGDEMIFVKGATSVILPLCVDYGDEKVRRRFTNKMKDQIMERVDEFANQGYRVISIAYRSIKNMDEIKSEDMDSERELAESKLSYVGFAVIYDPPRPGVSDAVKDLDNAGIFPIMITGDSPATAATIARQVGVLDPDELVVAGKDIPTLSDEDFFKVSVFARVSPQDKEIIVNRYQARGDVIAMAGDGVNDALAITRADAGVAMGKTGTEVTKDAADIIITDDSYISMVRGIEEGRNLYEKIRIMVFFYIAVNLAEAIIYFTSAFRVDFQILNNWQRVLIFSLVHSIPVFAIIFGPPDKGIMKLKPRASSDILSKPLMMTIAAFAITLATSTLLIYQGYTEWDWTVSAFNQKGIMEYIEFQVPNSNDPANALLPVDIGQAKARTMLLAILYIAESAIVLSIRRMNEPVWKSYKDLNKLVLASIVAAPILFFLMVYIYPIQIGLAVLGINFELILLNFLDLLLVIVAGLLPIAVIEGIKYVYRRKGLQF
ncbi:MAG: cation-transporting P-type ATPase [Candidatus Heimdallarchaeota archaeon]|nr:cation-transporting P-type ATPase [Candidatus Heimdallarchaeota archaeon]